MPGEATRDPAFGLPAMWIAEAERDKAERLGYTVVDPPSIIATHLTEIIKRHAAEILGRQEIQSMLDALKNDYPTVVEEVSKCLHGGRDPEGAAGPAARAGLHPQHGGHPGDPGRLRLGHARTLGFLVEKARQSLGRQICLQHADEHKTLRVLTLDPALEQKIIDRRVDTAAGAGHRAGAPAAAALASPAVSNAVHAAQEQGHLPVVLCSEAARPLRQGGTIAREIPHLVVLSVPEVVPEVRVESDR